MILVTGGTGLLGSHLLFELVRKGEQVRALKRSGSSTSLVKKVFDYYSAEKELFSKIEWVEGDILDVCSLFEAMEAVDQVYHCAALVSFEAKDRNHLQKINVEGTGNVMNIAMERAIKKVCHVSSIAALGRQDTQEEVDENSHWKDAPENSHYSISKYAAEREAWRAVEEGLNVVIVNPSIIIGPGDWDKGSSKMFAAASKGLKYYSDGVSGFVDVRDVVLCMIKLMENKISNHRFVINSENAPYSNFFNKLHDAFKTKRPHIKVGWFLTEIVWRIDTFKSLLLGIKPLITKESARSAHQKYYFSNKKIKETLGVDFLSIDRMIEDTCQAFKSGKFH